MKFPLITEKQKQILLFLYRFRFLNRIQIQKLLNHKNRKNTNVWLKDLTEKGFIGRIYKRTRDQINNPAQYYISKNGIQFLKSQPQCETVYLRKLYQETRRSTSFINQCILIADIYLTLWERMSGSDVTLKFYTQSDFPREGIIRDLLPSFAYIKEKKAKIEHFVCEILKESTPRYGIRGRVKKYIQFCSEDEEANMSVIFICPNEEIRKYVDRFSNRLLEEENITNVLLQTRTADNIKNAL